VLYQDSMLMLTGIDGITGFLKHGFADKARAAADEARKVMRLLDDLGWDRMDPRDSYALTMDDEALNTIMLEFKDRAEDCLRVNARDLKDIDPDEFPTDEKFDEWVADTREDNDTCLDIRAASLAVLGKEN
jgi:hypothetical protein